MYFATSKYSFVEGVQHMLCVRYRGGGSVGGGISTWLVLLCVAVERYDPRANRWSSVPTMGTRRKHLGVAVYNNMIYAVGGRDDSTELSSAERFNPNINQWQPVVAMTCRRSGVRIRRSSSP